ncbi:MAG: TVP38/TMEM64 family protein [Hyphomicrobiales bacterium]
MDPTSSPDKANSASLRRWIAPALILAAMVLAYAMGWHHYLSLRNLAEHREGLRLYTEAHPVFSILIFMGVYALAVMLSFPGAGLITITGGFLFGWIEGAVGALLGATLGACIIFEVAKSSFGSFLARRAGPKLARFQEGFHRNAFSYLLFLRLVPVFPFWLINLAAALTGLPLRIFAPATFIGIIPACLVYAYVGRGLDGLISRQLAAQAACAAQNGAENCSLELPLSSLITPDILLAFAALGLMALVPMAVKRVWGSR